MDKFNYGAFDSTKVADVFTKANNYDEPNGETEVRQQLSQPLSEIRDFVNNTAPVMTSNSNVAIQFGMANDRTIRYRNGPTDTWKETQSAGHTIQGDDGQSVARRAVLRFDGATVTNPTGENYTLVEGLQGPTGDTGPQGEPGGNARILGVVATEEDLYDIASPQIGDIYAVGPSQDTYTLYVYGNDLSLNVTTWLSLGTMDEVTGPAGPQGEQGPAGKNMVILGVVSTNSNLPQNANVGDAYTVIDDVGGGNM